MRRPLSNLISWLIAFAALAPISSHAEPAAADCCADGCELLIAYVPIAKALAADDLKTVQTSSAALVKQADADGMDGIVTKARAVGAATNLADARSAFKILSEEIKPLANDAKGYSIVTCPMAKADWVQRTGTLQNPYYAKSILTCATVKKAN